MTLSPDSMYRARLAGTSSVPPFSASRHLRECLVQASTQRARRGILDSICESKARTYGTAILPTRLRRPRDKAKVEVGVQVVERWILARLRDQRLFRLVELNTAIRTLLADLNGRPMRRLGISRRQPFHELDRPALAALLVAPYVYAEWRQRRVGLDHHVDVDGHYCSVPDCLLRQQVEALQRCCSATVSCSSRVGSRRIGRNET